MAFTGRVLDAVYRRLQLLPSRAAGDQVFGHQEFALILTACLGVVPQHVHEVLGMVDERGDAETAGPTEYHAVVTISSGPFQFTRRIKLEGK